jgi:hypothetical protein
MVSYSTRSQRAGDLAGLVPSHAVGQDEKPERRQGAIAVV